MRSRSSLLVIFISLLLVAASAAQQPVAAQSDTVVAKADQYLNAWANSGRFTGAVLLAKGDKVLLRKAYGMASYELDVPNTPETIFRIGSITKMFTAFSVLQLEERGLLNVNDPVAKYIPEMPKAWSVITIHQLLTHTSGIPDFGAAPSYSKFEDQQRLENALKESADTQLLSAPGEKLRYSNAGYILLGRLIEKVSGQRYEDYISSNILRPAGMTDTAYDHGKPVVKRRASGYIFDGEYFVNAKPEEMEWAHSAGALHSTLDDMYRFDRALKSGKLFSTAITTKAWTPYAKWVSTPPFNFDADYGYGWLIGNEVGHRYVGHGGWVGGFVSQFTRYPQEDAVVIVLSNVETVNIMPISRDLGAILLGAPYEVPTAHKIVHPDVKILERYVGKYQAGPIEVKITLSDGRLYAFGTGQRAPFGMVASSDTEFFVNDAPSELRFVLGADNKATHFMIHIDGKDMTLNRVGE